jgi:hypothetical protein
MKYKFFTLLFLCLITVINAQNDTEYKKRVLENAEVDQLFSFYSQKGDNAAVTGGIGDEKLTDIASNIVIAIPLNDDDVFSIDATVSAYTSASSSNLDPFSSGASGNGGDDDDDDDDDDRRAPLANRVTGSPWVASSGASKADVWVNGNFSYSHSSDNRNNIWSVNANFASEYDYSSIGFGGGYTRLFNEKNTEINLKANVYLDKWNPVYPTELDSYQEANQSLNNGFFANVEILDQSGNVIDKNGQNVWKPSKSFLVTNTSRNTYSLSLSFSQIINKNAQFSIFLDVVQQDGWLANPMQRVYFADTDNYYIGEAGSISNYTSRSNKTVFQLADDIERMPDTRLKTPIGARFNYYINEKFVLRTYYRYYTDDWGISAHTASLEIPIKISDKFTLSPSYRYYTQTAADYFAPYETHLSTQEFYTSDYDLSEFNSNQYGLAINYTDIFTKMKIWKLGLKKLGLKYSYYKRNTGLKSGIVSMHVKWIFE